MAILNLQPLILPDAKQNVGEGVLANAVIPICTRNIKSKYRVVHDHPKKLEFRVKGLLTRIGNERSRYFTPVNSSDWPDFASNFGAKPNGDARIGIFPNCRGHEHPKYSFKELIADSEG